ncbi:MBL fold metallo-hydrolase [Rubrivivax sp. A210]|uniref:MBL fold metallo-hydrolase n=1 Tax=Rubrivivax sp. A210 TaxID=2772301 RepID=UPI001918AACE|nr:MBL fold metallo-hydrolase [Rubrivivax sp. A210]
MKVVILRGGAVQRRAGGLTRADTADSGVCAVGVGDQWVLINVSAAVAHSLACADPSAGWPGLSDAKVRAIVLTDAQLEHAGGLLGLRRGAPIDLYATPAVFEDLSTHLPILPALQHYCGVHWRVIPVSGDQRVGSFQVEGLPTLEFTAIATLNPPWPHALEQRAPVVGESIALAVHDHATGRSVFCAPGLTMPGPDEQAWLRNSDCVLLDEPDPATAARLGWGEWLDQLPARHKVVLARDAEAPWLAGRGIALARDGMEIEL